MTPEDFKKARNDLGLSIRQAADIFGVDVSTLKRWESLDGTTASARIHPTAARAMQWLLDGYRPPEWPSRMQAGRPGPIPKNEKGAD